MIVLPMQESMIEFMRVTIQDSSLQTMLPLMIGLTILLNLLVVILVVFQKHSALQSLLDNQHRRAGRCHGMHPPDLDVGTVRIQF